MSKIKVEGTVVELDGDEMTRIIWQSIKDQLIHPYLDVNLEYYDLGIENRDATDDQVTIDAAHAIQKHGVGVKCATITPDEARVEEFGLKKMWKSAERHDPQHPRRRDLPRADHHLEHPAPRARLEQADHRRPPRVRRPVPRHRLPLRGRGHAHDRASRPKDGSRAAAVRGLPGARRRRRAWRMYNLDASIRDFARASLNYGLDRNYPVYLSTKNTILKAYDGRFKDLFQEVFDAEFKEQFDAAGLTYEHRLIDDMVAVGAQVGGRLRLGLQELRRRRAVRHRRAGLRLARPHDLACSPRPTARSSRPRRRTAPSRATTASTRQGKPTSTNPIASIYAWTRGLAHRGKLDGNQAAHRLRRHPRGRRHQDRRVGQHDEGPRDARRPRAGVPDDRGVPRDALGEPEGAPGRVVGGRVSRGADAAASAPRRVPRARTGCARQDGGMARLLKLARRYWVVTLTLAIGLARPRTGARWSGRRGAVDLQRLRPRDRGVAGRGHGARHAARPLGARHARGHGDHRDRRRRRVHRGAARRAHAHGRRGARGLRRTGGRSASSTRC